MQARETGRLTEEIQLQQRQIDDLTALLSEHAELVASLQQELEDL
eukprot:gene545-1555_t